MLKLFGCPAANEYGGDTKMLRITVEQNAATWRMRLEGKLHGEWVAEAESVWQSAPKAGNHEVDLSDVTCVDDQGRQVLDTMRRAGARFITKGVMVKAMLADLARVG